MASDCACELLQSSQYPLSLTSLRPILPHFIHILRGICSSSSSNVLVVALLLLLLLLLLDLDDAVALLLLLCLEPGPLVAAVCLL